MRYNDKWMINKKKYTGSASPDILRYVSSGITNGGSDRSQIARSWSTVFAETIAVLLGVNGWSMLEVSYPLTTSIPGLINFAHVIISVSLVLCRRHEGTRHASERH